MIFSFLLPPMMWLSRRLHWTVLLPLAVLGLWSDAPPYGWPRYALDFTLGIGLYEERERIGRLIERLPAPAALALLLLGLAGFTYPTYAIQTFAWWAVLPFGLGGSVLVASAAHRSRFAAVLSARPVAALGRISYSSYLLHFAVLCWLTRLIERRLGVIEGAAFIALVVACVLPVAAASYRFVERPSIRLGNRVCARLSASFGQPSRPSRRFVDGSGEPEPAS
jgi:peptidoglycan/LPS O-acetylase OafA/YrhL